MILDIKYATTSIKETIIIVFISVILSIKLLLTYPQNIIINTFPIKIENKNFRLLIFTIPQIILIKKAGVKGKAITNTKFEKDIFLNFFMAFSILFKVFFDNILFNILSDIYEKIKYEKKHPKQVAIQDKMIPMILPNAFTFNATKTPNGNTGIKDSSKISIKPNIKPPSLIN